MSLAIDSVYPTVSPIREHTPSIWTYPSMDHFLEVYSQRLAESGETLEETGLVVAVLTESQKNTIKPDILTRLKRAMMSIDSRGSPLSLLVENKEFRYTEMAVADFDHLRRVRSHSKERRYYLPIRIYEFTRPDQKP